MKNARTARAPTVMGLRSLSANPNPVAPARTRKAAATTATLSRMPAAVASATPVTPPMAEPGISGRKT
jgi:hypothetical protein